MNRKQRIEELSRTASPEAAQATIKEIEDVGRAVDSERKMFEPFHLPSYFLFVLCFVAGFASLVMLLYFIIIFIQTLIGG